MAMVDVNRLENAILNLVINARDAMPDAGGVTVENRVAEIDASYVKIHPGLKPGRYIVIAITDTVVGMSPELLEKVFDPFFTTKPIGQGTGLGLSMLYGFARQSNGQVRVHSEIGTGTSVSIFLPVGEDLNKQVDAVSTSLAEGSPCFQNERLMRPWQDKTVVAYEQQARSLSKGR